MYIYSISIKIYIIYIYLKDQNTFVIHSQGTIIFAQENIFWFPQLPVRMHSGSNCAVKGTILASGFPEQRTHPCQEASASRPLLQSSRPGAGAVHLTMKAPVAANSLPASLPPCCLRQPLSVRFGMSWKRRAFLRECWIHLHPPCPPGPWNLAFSLLIML